LSLAGNSLLLLVLSAGIIIDAALRMHHHDELQNVNGSIIICVGAVSLLVNIVKVYLLHPHTATSLNIRAVYIHTMADVAGAVSLIVGGVLVLQTGDNKYDSIFAVVIAALVILNVGWVVIPTIKLLCKGAVNPSEGPRPVEDRGGSADGSRTAEEEVLTDEAPVEVPSTTEENPLGPGEPGNAGGGGRGGGG